MCDEGVETELFERAVALEDELDGLELDYGPSARYARVLYDGGFYDRARPLLERLCERGRASGDAAVNMPLFLLASIEIETGSGRTLTAHARESTTSRSRPGGRLLNLGGSTRSRGSRLSAEIRNSPESTLSRRS